jgi:hypothetical protein
MRPDLFAAQGKPCWYIDETGTRQSGEFDYSLVDDGVEYVCLYTDLTDKPRPITLPAHLVSTDPLSQGFWREDDEKMASIFDKIAETIAQ